MTLTIYTDGGSLNNPGQAAYGYVICHGSIIMETAGKQIGIATNNVAEYTGLVSALERILTLKQSNKLIGLSKVLVYADSALMINQLNGLFKIKKPHLKELSIKIHTLVSQINAPIIYTHVPREQNQLADSLVKKSLKTF